MLLDYRLSRYKLSLTIYTYTLDVTEEQGNYAKAQGLTIYTYTLDVTGLTTPELLAIKILLFTHTH